MKAQVFEVGEDGRLCALHAPHDVAALAREVLAEFSERRAGAQRPYLQ